MGEAAFFIALVDAVAREATLFAAIWFLVGGADDLLVDLVYGWRVVRAWWRGGAHAATPLPIAAPGRIAVFVAAWDEAAVIGQMLRTALERFDYPDYRLYVGTYPNDRPTIDAVAEVAAGDARVRLVIGPRPGPTTKADCLNALWRALLRDEVAGGEPVLAVVLHDAEDVVHPLELRVIAHALGGCEAVQIPVLPLVDPRSPLVAGHYIDEFAEAHGKTLVVRETLGAGMPLAGVGCAVRRDMLGRIAARRGGLPFDESSLTEDYELGLTIATMGGRTVLARVPDRPGVPVAVRAFFPHRLGAAIRQKGRWMTGIALAGWDRTGWAAAGKLSDHWMRMRDRRATLAIPVLMVAYGALAFWGLSWSSHWLAGSAAPSVLAPLGPIVIANLALLGWRLLVRALFVWRAYGWVQAALSVPRMLVGNYIALLAARRALVAYARLLAGGVPKWDKTAHHFPDDPERAAA